MLTQEIELGQFIQNHRRYQFQVSVPCDESFDCSCCRRRFAGIAVYHVWATSIPDKQGRLCLDCHHPALLLIAELTRELLEPAEALRLALNELYDDGAYATCFPHLNIPSVKITLGLLAGWALLRYANRELVVEHHGQHNYGQQFIWDREVHSARSIAEKFGVHAAT